jgi:tight adherence protein C
VFDLLFTIFEPTTMLAILSAVAVFATIVTVAMPMLARDELSARMKSTAIERDKIRARERARLSTEANKGPRAALRQDTSGLMRDIVEKLNLKKALADENTFSNLKMAGYRKQSHIYVFLFFRIVLPLLMFLAAMVYVFGISGMERPFMVKMTIVLFVAYAGFYAPNLFVKNQIGKRQLSIRRAWPDALDLMLICVESGMSIEAAFRKVAVEIGIQSPPLAEELVLTNAELSYLEERRKAYDNLASRTGIDGVKSVTVALIQAERYGTPLGTALRVLAQENRDLRMSEAEKKAAALPPKLTVPMILFFLPVLFAVIMGPAFIQIFGKTG